jgi:hypothetical protein
MSVHPDHITGPEFTRWTTELTRQIAANASAVNEGLGRIERQLAEINGRTRKNTESILVIERDLDAIKSEDTAIDEKVDDLKTNGCAQFLAHENVLRELGWTPKKKAAVAGGLVGTGVLAWPAIQKIAEAAHAFLEKLP